MNTLKEMVQPGKKVKFTRYLDGNLWYTTDCGFEFPVPTSDTGNATFLAEDKAMLFMRYMRKHIATITEGKAQ